MSGVNGKCNQQQPKVPIPTPDNPTPSTSTATPIANGQMKFEKMRNWDMSQRVNMFCLNESVEVNGINKKRLTCHLIPGCGHVVEVAKTKANKIMRAHFEEHFEVSKVL